MTQSDLLLFIVLVLPFGVMLWVAASLLVLHFWKDIVDYREAKMRKKQREKADV